ncbi:hypothetical protein QN277_020163 [Acacia crassicarpa]|uniref:Uncharacterized protein n=1 Tax=Acacia crassicarpa TaxID=499986 RepID=A0AAE1JNY4_9FABA|nr:hypothetical protein K1719_008064 [Acacia pycnantha]KAK4271469.1 hypothetical protein QN277_020163 [Acacia crassicarpa]
MGFMGSLEWPNYFDKKRCKTLFFRLRAKLKKALKDSGASSSHKKKQLRFQYDPSSYALNFDDGSCCFSNNFEDETKKKKTMLIRDEPSVLGFYTDVNNTTWVYVVWGPILGH